MTAFYKIIIVYDLIICLDKLLTYRYTVDTAERRPLTAGAVNPDADVDSAISPDGRRLAFVRIITLIKVPAESVLTFQLDQPLQVTTVD